MRPVRDYAFLNYPLTPLMTAGFQDGPARLVQERREEKARRERLVRMTTAYFFKCRVVAICFFWYMTSSVQSIVNKTILLRYPYPITVAISNQIFIPILAAPILKHWAVKEARLSKTQFRRYLLPIAFGRAIASASAAFSLSLMPVSYQQTVKALMPLFAVGMGRLVLGEKQTPIVYMSLLPIVAGVLIATVTEISFSGVGLVAALISTATYSLLNILVKKLLKQSDIHPVRLLAITSQACAVVLFPLWLIRDAYPMGVDLVDDSPAASKPDLHLLFLLLCSGICSFGQNVCAFSLIHMLTALSYAVTNATKRITVIVCSLLALHNPVTATNVVGMMMAVGGVFCYNQAKQTQKEHDIEDSPLIDGTRHSLPMTRTHTTLSDATLVAMDTGASSDMLYWATKRPASGYGGSRLADVISNGHLPNGISGEGRLERRGAKYN